MLNPENGCEIIHTIYYSLFLTMPKFLCLPGYLQSGKVFAEKSSGLRKLLTKKLNYELVYIDPPTIIKTKEDLPFVLAADENEANEKWQLIVDNNLNRCWWVHTEDGRYEGFKEAMEYVVKHIQETGPYDGIIGFSQGAAMSAAVANTLGSFLPNHGHLKVAVLFSSFAFTLPINKDETMSQINSDVTDVDTYKGKVELVSEYANFFAAPADFSTAIASVYGSEDAVVPAVRSEYLAQLYPPGTVTAFKHDGGHYLPNKKQFLNPIVEYIKHAVEVPASL